MRLVVSLIASAVLSLGLVSPSWAEVETKSDIQHASAIDATDPASNYAVIAPTYTGNGSGPQTYVRLFSGAGYGGKTSTFTVAVVATPSGRTYGSFTVAIPYMASIQYSIQEIIQLAGAAALNGGDTGYSVYLKNADPEAGYQHAIYDWTTELFENGSNCNTTINDQMLALHNRKVLTNVHTSAIANNTYPSTIYVHNYATTSKTYVMYIYNAGDVHPPASTAIRVSTPATFKSPLRGTPLRVFRWSPSSPALPAATARSRATRAISTSPSRTSQARRLRRT